jgi:hypothetical protein
MVAWLVGDHLLFRYFGPYGKLLFNVVVITSAMVMLLRDFWAYGITIMGCEISSSHGGEYDVQNVHPRRQF